MFSNSNKNSYSTFKCNCKIRQTIIIHNLSTKPKKTYYGCSNCFLEVNKISSQFQKKETEINSIKREEKASTSCLHYYGYLTSHLKDTNIPQECLVCPKLLECMRN